jgi:chromosome segregation ATPase
MTDNEYQELVAFLGKQFETIDRRFDAIDRRFDGVDRRFDAVDRRFDAVEVRLDAHDERFREILGHFDNRYRRLERLEQEYQAILEGLRRIEQSIAAEKTKREDIQVGIDLLKHHVASLQMRIEDLEQRLR